MSKPAAGDPSAIPNLIAGHILTSAPDAKVSRELLAGSISEITVETQTMGSALLAIQMIDPTWLIYRSGICDKDSDGLLRAIDVNFPEGTEVWWRLAMVDKSDDSTSPNLTLTFQMRVVSWMQNDFGPVAVRPGTSTRAQFVKQLVDRIPRALDSATLGPGYNGPIRFVCPELNVVQPVAGSGSAGGTTVVIPSTKAGNVTAQVNKSRGIGAGAALTVLGRPITETQRTNANIGLHAGQTLGAPEAAMVALIYAGMGESKLGEDPSTFAGTGGAAGVWQAQATHYQNGHDTAGMATAFFQGGQDFQAGGAIVCAQRGDPIWQIANEVEANAVWLNSRGDSYAHNWPGGQAEGIAEAQAIVDAYGGGKLGGGWQAPGQSDVGQLTRGTPNNPDEDTWACLQRLASEVNWSVFVSPSPAPGVWGNFLYYMDGPDLVAQRPSLYIRLSDDGTTWSATDPDSGKTIAGDGMVTGMSTSVDNTAFVYQQTRKVKGKVQRRTGLRTPQTPTQTRFAMVAGVMEYNAGDVSVIQNAGPLNGRWIVNDVTHNTLGDLAAQFTLGPPTYPYPEPQGTQSLIPGAPGITPTVAGSGLAAVASAARTALSAQIASGRTLYQYSEAANRGNGGTLFGPAPRTMDCSAFATLCYKAAGLSDPSHESYNPIGWTGSLIGHCQKISQGDAVPGDLCFFGSSESATTHVNVYVGNGQSISMGAPGDPSIGPSASMGPSGFLGFYRSDVAGSQPAGQNPAILPKVPKTVLTGTQDVSQGFQQLLGGIFTGPFGK